MSLAPPPEAVYPDVTIASKALQEHVKGSGYAFFRRSSKLARVLYTCDRAGKYDPRGKGPATHRTKQRINTGSKKCDCLIRVELRLDSISRYWSVRVLEPAHNHGPSAAPTAHPAHRLAALQPDTRASICNMSQAGLLPSQILTTLRTTDPAITLVPSDITNITQQARTEELGGKTPIQWLLDVRNLTFT